MEEKILRLRDVMGKVGLGRTTIYKLIGENRFPPGILLGVRARGWTAESINLWISTRPQGRC